MASFSFPPSIIGDTRVNGLRARIVAGPSSRLALEGADIDEPAL
jgi:hypothetical protein